MLAIDQAELLGMHAGDGTLYKTSSGIVWELRGNVDEKEFYDWYVVPLLKRLGFEVTGHYRSGGKNGCYGVRCCKKEFRKLLLENGYGVGRKTGTVRIPPSVMAGSAEIKAAFLAGLFATDGCAYVQRGYPFVEMATTSEKLAAESLKLLDDLGIKGYSWTYQSTWKPMHHIRISGRKVQRFCDIVGLLNLKHLRRIAHLIKY